MTMKRETFEIVAASLEEARSQANARTPEECFVLSQTVLSDGRALTLREAAESTEAASKAARSKVPIGFRVDHEEETRSPEITTVRILAEGEAGARSKAQSQIDKDSAIKKITLATPGKRGFLGIGKTQNQYDVEILRYARVEIRCKSDAKLSVTIGKSEEAVKEETAILVRKALEIINREVVLAPVFQVKSAGDKGAVMDAANLLRQASTLESDNANLHCAYVGALRLAAQFKAADEENARLIELHPDCALARFSSEAWSGGGFISPSPFVFPEWTPTSTTLPMFYQDKLLTCTIFPAREGIHPRAVLFEKDGEGWWTAEKLRGVKAEVAVVLVSELGVAAIYRRCKGPICRRR
jgi:hypothetical protein